MGSTSNSRSHTTFSRRVDLSLPQGTSPWQNSSVGPHSAPQCIFQAFSQHPTSLCSHLFLGSLSAPRNCPHSLSKFPPLLQLSHTPSTLCSLVLCVLNKGPSLFLQVKGPSTQRSIMAFSSRRQRRPQSIGTSVILFPPRSTCKISFNPQNPSARRGETLEVQRC